VIFISMITLNFAVTSVLLLWAVTILYAFASAIWKRRKASGDHTAIREIMGQSMVQYCRNNVPSKLLWLLVALSLGLIAAGIMGAV